MHVMLDLETLGLTPGSVILTIGAIKFNPKDPNTPLNKSDVFYKRITIHSCKEVGLVVDPKTLEWWNKQDPVIRKEAFEGDRIPLKQALLELNDFFLHSTYVWCQGANFDVPILEHAYAKCGLAPPWQFYNVRDTRTVYHVANFDSRTLNQKNKHNSLQDCINQIECLKIAYKRIKIVE